MQCEFKFHKGIMVVKKCRNIKTKEEIPTKEILKEIGIRSV